MIAKKVNLRNTPELVFEFDETLEYGARIDSIINDIVKRYETFRRLWKWQKSETDKKRWNWWNQLK